MSDPSRSRRPKTRRDMTLILCCETYIKSLAVGRLLLPALSSALLSNVSGRPPFIPLACPFAPDGATSPRLLGWIPSSCAIGIVLPISSLFACLLFVVSWRVSFRDPRSFPSSRPSRSRRVFLERLVGLLLLRLSAFRRVSLTPMLRERDLRRR